MAESEHYKDVFVDIPFITEDIDCNDEDKRSLSKGGSSLVVPWLETKSSSNSPSPSSSFRDDGVLITRKHTVPFVFVSGQPQQTSSLEDLRRKNSDCYCEFSRHNSSRRSNYSEYGGSFRQSRRKSSNCSDRRTSSMRSSVRSSRSRKGSNHFERSRSARSSKSSRRMSNNVLEVPKSQEDLEREKRHRIAVWLVLGAFIFIAISSILVVIVTLTHQSEYIHHDNNTVTYYTFLRPSNFSQVILV